MAFGKKKTYVQCKPKEKGVLACIAYNPDKDGNKQVIANAEFLKSPDGDLQTLSHDGDPEEIEMLTRHALKYLKNKGNRGDF